MDLVNDLSSDLALAVFVEGHLSRKLPVEDAKTFIALVEAELNRISERRRTDDSNTPLAVSTADLSH
jgi:hypothetical protein